MLLDEGDGDLLSLAEVRALLHVFLQSGALVVEGQVALSKVLLLVHLLDLLDGLSTAASLEGLLVRLRLLLLLLVTLHLSLVLCLRL